MVIDEVSRDEITEAGFSGAAKARALEDVLAAGGSQSRRARGTSSGLGDTLKAWPKTRVAANTTSGGRRSTKSGIAMVSGDNATPRSSTPMLRRNRPTVLSSLVVRFEKLIEPVRSERSWNVAVPD